MKTEQPIERVLMLTLGKKTLTPGIEWIEKPKPQPRPDEVLIQVLYSSICGTDHHIYEMNPWAQGRIQHPYTMGHEFVGRIVEVGAKVKQRKVGDVVSAETHIVCNHCEFCLSDQKHICENTKVIGVDMDGCFAQYIALPEDNARLNDENLDLPLYSIQEPLGNAVHTLMAQPIEGKSVAIVGVGPIGILGLDAALALGARQVIAIDVIDYRLDLARRLGAHATLNAQTDNVHARILELCGPHGVDVVCEMSGNAQAIQEAFKYVKPGGHISFLGIPNHPILIDITHDIVFKGIHLHGITGRRMYQTWDQVKALIRTGKLQLDKIVTHVLDWNDVDAGMELMRTGQCGKVVLKIAHDEPQLS